MLNQIWSLTTKSFAYTAKSELERSRRLLYEGWAIFSDGGHGDNEQAKPCLSHDYDRQAATWI